MKTGSKASMATGSVMTRLYPATYRHPRSHHLDRSDRTSCCGRKKDIDRPLHPSRGGAELRLGGEQAPGSQPRRARSCSSPSCPTLAPSLDRRGDPSIPAQPGPPDNACGLHESGLAGGPSRPCWCCRRCRSWRTGWSKGTAGCAAREHNAGVLKVPYPALLKPADVPAVGEGKHAVVNDKCSPRGVGVKDHLVSDPPDDHPGLDSSHNASITHLDVSC